MKNFKQLKVWKQGMGIVKQVYTISRFLPDEERYGLRSQMTRAAVSIPSNIAEGSSRQSDPDYRRFLEISLGSSFELETQLLIVKELELAPNSPEGSIDRTLAFIEEEQRMISGLIAAINRDINQASSR
jgi:four helix bundle protein